jgi:hypothetical protein
MDGAPEGKSRAALEITQENSSRFIDGHSLFIGVEGVGWKS